MFGYQKNEMGMSNTLYVYERRLYNRYFSNQKEMIGISDGKRKRRERRWIAPRKEYNNQVQVCPSRGL